MTSPLKSREALRKFLEQHPCPARQDAALGELLVAGGDLHAEQLEQALEHQRQNPAAGRLGQVLLRLKMIDADRLASAIARQLDIPRVALADFDIEESALALLPEEIARRYQAIPLMSLENRLMVATPDPTRSDLAHVLMFVTGCVKFERVGRALSAQVIVLVAASIALGKLVLVTGAAEWLGQVLAAGLQFLPAAGVLAAMMLFVTVLTNFASNATAAAVGTPIAFSLAQSLGLPAEPLVLAVLFGCNLCYATPVAYQTNMMIMSEGDYVFKDYVRTGLPLVILMVVTLSTLLVLRYDL